MIMIMMIILLMIIIIIMIICIIIGEVGGRGGPQRAEASPVNSSGFPEILGDFCKSKTIVIPVGIRGKPCSPVCPRRSL